MTADGLVKEGMVSKHYHFPGSFQAMELLKGSTVSDLLVTAGDTMIELGHPVTASVCLGLITQRDGLVVDGRVTVVGGELQELTRGRHSFALIVLAEAVEVNEGCRYALARKMSAGNDLAGCMTRVMSDRIWIRLGKEALNRGLTLGIMGSYLISELKKEKGRFEKVEVIFITAEKDKVDRLRLVADRYKESNIIRYKEELKKRVDCDSPVDCGKCPDTDVCQVFKDAAVISGNKERVS